MKRSAERQLTKDDGGDDDDIEVIQEPQDFQKADESTLAKRQIRALPKRALTSSRLPSLNGLSSASASDVGKAEVAPQLKFGGFAGFGAPTSASSPFTFATQPPAGSAPSPSVFDPTFKLAQPTPAFASPSLGAPKPADVSLSKPSPSVEETDTVALKYFKSLRGLNVSFISAISAAVEKDPFCDVANLVESYKNLRTTIQSDFDGSPQPPTSRGPFMTSSASIFGVKAQPERTPSFVMPKPPPETSSKLPPISESATKAGNFAFPPFVPPSHVPAQLPFGLNPNPSEPPTSTPGPPKSAFAFATARASAPVSNQALTPGLPFVPPLSAENDTSKSVSGLSSQETEGSSTSASSRPGSTAPSFGSSSVPNFFASTKLTSAFGNSEAPKPTSAFSGPAFGSSGTAESSRSTPFNPFPSDGKNNTKLTTSLFGNATAGSSSTSASIFRPSDKPASAFGSAFQISAFGGKPGGSIGNPVGFGFGSSTTSAGETTTPEASSSGFTFGVSSTKFGESLFSPPMTDKSSESTPQPEAEGNEDGGEEDTAKLLPSHMHDEEGEGEEDEETTHVARCKVYRLFKTDEKNEWKDLGIGMFRLKRHKETNVRRILMRNSNTGRILINFRIHASLKPTLTKASVTFVGYEDSTPTSFMIRVKTEEQAKDLKQAIDREIAAVQSMG